MDSDGWTPGRKARTESGQPSGDKKDILDENVVAFNNDYNLKY